MRLFFLFLLVDGCCCLRRDIYQYTVARPLLGDRTFGRGRARCLSRFSRQEQTNAKPAFDQLLSMIITTKRDKWDMRLVLHIDLPPPPLPCLWLEYRGVLCRFVLWLLWRSLSYQGSTCDCVRTNCVPSGMQETGGAWCNSSFFFVPPRFNEGRTSSLLFFAFFFWALLVYF